MCLLALFFRVFEDAPVVAGANREESYARGGEPPRLHDGTAQFVAGLDPQSGGTWLGVNQHGLLVALTNRPKTQPPAQPRSRGLLVKDLLSDSRRAGDAVGHATQELGKNLYAGCNLLCVDAHSAYVLHSGDWLRVRPLPPGLHVLTANDVNDASDRRLAHAQGWLLGRPYERTEQCVDALKELCGQTGDPPMCLHSEQGGTVSSTIVALKHSLDQSAYWHAQGPPDRTPYEDHSHLLHELAAM